MALTFSTSICLSTSLLWGGTWRMLMEDLGLLKGSVRMTECNVMVARRMWSVISNTQKTCTKLSHRYTYKCTRIREQDNCKHLMIHTFVICLLNWAQIHRRTHKNTKHAHNTQPFIHTQTHKEEHLKTSESSLAKRSEIKIKTLQHSPSIKSQGFRHHLHPKRKKKRARVSWTQPLILLIPLSLFGLGNWSRPSLWLSNIHYHVGNLPKDGCVPSTLFSSHLWLFEKIKLGASLCSLLTAQILHRDRQDGACCPQMAMLETDNNKPVFWLASQKAALNKHGTKKSKAWAGVLIYIPPNHPHVVPNL